MKTGLYIVFFVLLAITPKMGYAIETLSDAELSNVTAKEGVTIFLQGKISMTDEFTNVGIGDKDGIGHGTSGGWLVLDSGGETSFVDVTLEDAKIEIDVASTGKDGLDVNGDGTIDIPGYTSFVQFKLPTNIAVNTFLANGYHVYLNNQYSTVGASYMGELRISDIQIQMNSLP